MPKRMIDTGIWSDDRVTELTSHAQLVYLRLILGDETGPAGATRVAPKRIAADVNITRAEAETAITQLTETGLIRTYDGGWIWLPAFIRYQLSGPHFIRGIRRQATECPDALNRAITRATDAIVGPGTEHIAEKRATRKHATSRGEIDGPPTDHGPFEREVQDQDQDQDQDRPNGLSVLVQAEESNGAGPGRPDGRPAPVVDDEPPRAGDMTDAGQHARRILDMLKAGEPDAAA